MSDENPGLSKEEIKRSIEAMALISPEGVTVKRLAEVLGCDRDMVQQAADDLVEDYRKRGSGLAILPVADGYQLVTNPELADIVDKFITTVRKRQLSQAALETLAIIAYRQPITTPEIEAIRGVDSSGVIQGLLDKKLIRLGGRKKAPGRPLLYRTTREFLLHFGLKDLRDLPALSELGSRQMPEADAEEEN